jgi:hypothetical protein
MTTLATSTPRADGYGQSIFEKLWHEATEVGLDDYATKVRGKLRVAHRHRFRKRYFAEQLKRFAGGSVNAFTRAKIRERSVTRQIFPVSWPDGNRQPIRLTRSGPNGAGYVLRFVDLGRPTRRRENFFVDKTVWRSDLYEDFKLRVKTGGLREDGEDLVYETYDRHWAGKAVEFLGTRGYDLDAKAVL